jgi:hypothetical protein
MLTGCLTDRETRTDRATIDAVPGIGGAPIDGFVSITRGFVIAARAEGWLGPV